MSKTIICKPSPVKTLAVTQFPLRELLNFLTCQQNPELLNERVRRQPVPAFERIPTKIKELKEVLKAERCDKNKKLFINCERSENHIAVLLHNEGAQFWIHYFRCGIGLVNLSFFSHLAGAEGSLSDGTRVVTHSHEYQWFTHDLKSEFFAVKNSPVLVAKLCKYFIKQVNPTLVCPYSIYYEGRRIKEPYKFVSGSLEQLTAILRWSHFVCEGLKKEKEANGKIYVSPHVTITCGNLKSAPVCEHSTETFINAVGALAVRENSPYTVLHKSFGRRDLCDDWERKNKSRIFLNLGQNGKDVPVREKIAARYKLVSWLKQKGLEGERIIKTWHWGGER